MLTRPVSCGVTATIDAMASKELTHCYSPFDTFYDEKPGTPVMWLRKDEQALAQEIQEITDMICEA